VNLERERRHRYGGSLGFRIAPPAWSLAALDPEREPDRRDAHRAPPRGGVTERGAAADAPSLPRRRGVRED
jgi:hypothetical protein